MRYAMACALAGALLVVPGAAAQEVDLERELALRAQDGVTFRTPAWTKAKHEDAVAVVKRDGGGGQGAVSMLLLSVEPGPAEVEEIDWKVVRDNVVEAAGEAGGELALEVGESWDDAEGFRGRVLSGELTRDEQTLRVRMIVLAAPGKLVTVSGLVAGDGKPKPGGLVDRVAQTTAAGGGDEGDGTSGDR